MRTNAQDPWPSFYKGVALYQKNELEQAVDYLERAQAFAPKAALFNRTLGLAYLKSGDEIRGVNGLRKALLLQPHDIDTVLDLARAYQETGESEKARILLTDGMNNQFRDSTTEAHKKIKEALVVLYQTAGQNIENISEARVMHARSPDNPFVGLRLAQLESKVGNYEFAGRLVARVQRALPDLADAWRVGAEVAIGEGRYTQALSALERLQSIDSADPVLPWLRAEALLHLNRLQDAEKEAQLAIQRNPKAAGPHLILLEIHRKTGDAAGMRRLSEFLLVQFPDSKEILRASATAHISLKEFSSALNSLSRLELMEPQNGEIALDLGKTLLALGKRGEAALKFEKAAQLLSKDSRGKCIDACEQLAALDAEAARRQFEVLANLNLTAAEQVRVQSRLAFLRHHAKEPLAALAAAAEIRRTGDMRRSLIQAMRLLQLGRAHRGVTELYEVMKQQQLLTDEGALLAFDAFLELGEWQKAQAALESVQARSLKESPRAFSGVIRSLAGSGQLTLALVQLDKALAGKTDSGTYDLKVLKLRILANSQPEKALAWLPHVTQEAGVDPTPFLLGAEAALALAQEDVARPLLLEAIRRRAPAPTER
ncbi:MAG TPA: tetratricopeptide repeat protein, partial [Planctomycetota bacterium]|nr:tetratricopeptide repeat protein [Planctomycetota bacterium]